MPDDQNLRMLVHALVALRGMPCSEEDIGMMVWSAEVALLHTAPARMFTGVTLAEDGSIAGLSSTFTKDGKVVRLSGIKQVISALIASKDFESSDGQVRALARPLMLGYDEDQMAVLEEVAGAHEWDIRVENWQVYEDGEEVVPHLSFTDAKQEISPETLAWATEALSRH